MRLVKPVDFKRRYKNSSNFDKFISFMKIVNPTYDSFIKMSYPKEELYFIAKSEDNGFAVNIRLPLSSLFYSGF